MSLGPTSRQEMSQGGNGIPSDPSVYRDLLQLYRPIDQCRLEDKRGALSRLPNQVARQVFSQTGQLAGCSADESISEVFVLKVDEHLRSAIHRVACRFFDALSPQQQDEVRRRSGQAFVDFQRTEEFSFPEMGTEAVLNGLTEYFSQARQNPDDLRQEPISAEAAAALERFASVFAKDSSAASRTEGSFVNLMMSIPMEVSYFVRGLRLLIEICQDEKVMLVFVRKFLAEDSTKASPLLDQATREVIEALLQVKSASQLKEKSKSEDLNYYRTNMRAPLPTYLWMLVTYDMFYGDKDRGSSLMLFTLSFLQSQKSVRTNWINEAMTFFKHCDLDLMRQSPETLVVDGHCASSADQVLKNYRNELSRYTYLGMAVAFFHVASAATLYLTCQLLPDEQIEKVVGLFFSLVVRETKNISIPPSDKMLLLSVCRCFLLRLSSDRGTSESFQLLKRFASGSIALGYLEVFSTKLDALGWGNSSPDIRNSAAASKKLASFFEHALEYREKYENYIPWILEILTLVEQGVARSEKDLFLAGNLLGFLQWGNVESLISRLKQAQGNIEQMGEFLYQSVKEFADAEKAGQNRKHSFQAGMDRSFKSLDHILVSYPRMVAVLMKRYISDFKPVDPSALYVGPSKFFDLQQQQDKEEKLKKLKAKRKKKRTAGERQLSKAEPQGQPASSELKSISSHSALESLSSSQEKVSSSSSSAGKSATSSSSASGVAQEPSFNHRLQGQRTRLKKWVEQLKKGRSSSAVIHLEDAYRHFDNLLCNLRRLHNQALRGEIAPSILFSFSHDCVRYCTLGVEQLLSALYRETNSSAALSRQPPALSHDLIYMLRQCENLSKDFSSRLWKWFKEINRGEIIVRDFRLLTRDEGVLQNLLRQAQELVADRSSSSDQLPSFFKAVFAYLNPLGNLLESIPSQFPLVAGHLIAGGVESEFVQMLGAFCQEMPNAIRFEQADQDPFAEFEHFDLVEPLIDLRASLTEAKQKDPTARSFGELENVQSNLLVNLEAELLSHGELEPIETSLHLKNILLLNQCIAEAVLLFKLRVRGIEITSDEEYRHDLICFVDKLEIRGSFTSEEIEFLQRGRSSRQLIRYPAAYVGQRSQHSGPSGRTRLQEMEELISSSDRLAANQSADQDLQGFLPGRRSDENQYKKIKAFVLRDLQLLAAIVGKVLSA